MCNHEGNKRIGCGCGCHGGVRRFHTKDEKRAQLEEYREELRKELQAVEERIGELGERA